LQSTPAFDESKTIVAIVATERARVVTIEQNVLEAAQETRETRTHEVFDGNP
jgi:hypothetical protein